jgi:hypothetical protein
MRAIPFSYLEQKDTGPVVIPQESNILLRYEDVATNFTGSTTGTWNDTSGLSLHTTASLVSGTGDLSSGSLQLADRFGNVKIQTNTDIDVKSLVVVFNSWKASTVGGSSRDYFWDMRKSGNSNGGYFNQFDSVSTNSTHLFGNNGEYYSYDETDGTTTSAQLTTPANLTNGTLNSNGGSATDQWQGPNGKSAYYPKRMWHFNFNTTTPLGFRIGSNGGYFGSNDNGLEAGPLGFFAIIGWSVALTASEVNELVAYFKDQGVLS